MPESHDRAPHHLIDAVYRYAIPLAALLAAGPVCYRFTHALTAAASGSDDTTLFFASSKPSALIALVVSLALAVAVAMVGSRLIGMKSSLISAGYVLGWAAWGLGDVNWVLRDLGSASAVTFILLALEAAVVATACFGTLWLAARAESSTPDLFKLSFSTKRLVSTAAAAAAALAATWIVVHTGTKGQTLFGALIAGLLASIASHMAGDEEHPDALAPFLGVAIAAILSPLVAIVYPGLSGIEKAVVTDALPGFARLQPLDWSVALLIGVPVGLNWMGIALGREGASSAPHAANA